MLAPNPSMEFESEILLTGNPDSGQKQRALGASALYRQDIGAFAGERISALIGYRYPHSSDKLSIPTVANAAGVVAITGNDAFNTASDFHGIDLGLVGTWRSGPWMLEWRGEVALGANLNSANINGASTISGFGATTNFSGNFLAVSSNIGNYSQTRFAAVPELALKAAYEFAPRWQLVGGYDLLYWTGVQRAGGLIDTTVNPNLIPPNSGGGPARPMPVFNTTSLLAQGFSFGVRYNY